MKTIFVCLGGTGTQLGRVIGNLYPLLHVSGIVDEPFDMYILDKDTNSGIFKGCTGAQQRYEQYHEFLPFKHLAPFSLEHRDYQNMQGAAGFRNKEYTILDIIGSDTAVKDLASMCWIPEKMNESIKDGNNRDPSRGSLDAEVCLQHLKESSLYKGIAAINDKENIKNVRVVILGGATGGMGSSLIVPVAKCLYESFPDLRVDFVVLGTYFDIPKANAQSAVDNIGSSKDAYYRAADQLKELTETGVVHEGSRLYYGAIPYLDTGVSGDVFEKNGANRRFHLLELCAALAAFEMEKKEPAFYGTSLDYDYDPESKDGSNKSRIEWGAIPCGQKIKESAFNFMKLLSILACRVYPTLYSVQLADERAKFIKKYFPKKRPELIEQSIDILKQFLQNIAVYFDFWNEIQCYSKIGRKDGKDVVYFFDREDMKNLGNELEETAYQVFNFIPFIKDKNGNPEPWQDILSDLKADTKKISLTEDARELVKIMVESFYNSIITH